MVYLVSVLTYLKQITEVKIRQTGSNLSQTILTKKSNFGCRVSQERLSYSFFCLF